MSKEEANITETVEEVKKEMPKKKDRKSVV